MQKMIRAASFATFLALVFPAASFAAPKYRKYPEKFDLVCHGIKKIVYEPYPPEHGLAMTYQPGAFDIHYPVDIDTMEYCVDKVCSGGGRRKIAFMRGDRLVFEDTNGWETVNLASQIYDYVSGADDEGIVRAVHTKCRLAPFSGFRW